MSEKKPVSWLMVIKEKIKAKPGSSIKDIMPEAKKEWKLIKENKHPTKTVMSMVGIKKKKSMKRKPMKKNKSMKQKGGSPEEVVEEVESSMVENEMPKNEESQKGGNCGCVGGGKKKKSMKRKSKKNKRKSKKNKRKSKKNMRKNKK